MNLCNIRNSCIEIENCIVGIFFWFKSEIHGKTGREISNYGNDYAKCGTLWVAMKMCREKKNYEKNTVYSSGPTEIPTKEIWLGKWRKNENIFAKFITCRYKMNMLRKFNIDPFAELQTGPQTAFSK